VRTSGKTWSMLTLFLLLVGLAVYLTAVVRWTADDPWQDVSVAGYVAIGCGVSAALALGVGLLLLHRGRHR
jgi:hypothetical protein